MADKKQQHTTTITLVIKAKAKAKAKDRDEAIFKANNAILYGMEETAHSTPPSGVQSVYVDGKKLNV